MFVIYLNFISIFTLKPEREREREREREKIYLFRL